MRFMSESPGKYEALTQGWQAFRAALQLLTIIPSGPTKVPVDAIARSLPYYPLVGLLVGSILALAFALCANLTPLLSAITLTILWVIMSGGLHLDGLADLSDAWVGGFQSREKTLSIMQDPRCGAMAVIAITAVLLLKVACLHALISESEESFKFIYLIAIPALARLLVLPAFYWLPYVRKGGLGEALGAALTRRKFYTLLLIALSVITLILPTFFALTWILTLSLVFLLWRHLMLKRLGGFTGDCAGSLIEISEVLLLFSAVVVSN